MTVMNGTVDATRRCQSPGFTTSDDDVKLTAEGNVTLEAAVSLGEGDLLLDVNGDVSQLAAGTINAAGLGLMVEGETVLNEANDIDVLATNNNGATQVNDINDLKVGEVTIEAVSADRAMFAMNGTIDSAAMSIDGITSSNDDVKLTADGNLTVEAAVFLGSGDSDGDGDGRSDADGDGDGAGNLFLDVNGDVSQLADGTISAAGLGLMVEGVTLLNAANDIDVLAADNNGATQVSNVNDLKVGSVTVEAVSADRAMFAMNGTIDAAAMSVDGVTTSDDDVKLTAEGNLTLERAVNLGEGDLLLDVDGDVTQLPAGTIDAAGLGLMVDGETVLNAANDVDVFAADNNGATQFNDINELRVGAVTAEAVSADRAMSAMNGTVDADVMSITGVMTSDDDVKLTADGDLTLEEAVNLGEGDLFLDATGNVTQFATGTINAAGLGLMVDGETVLNAGNDVDALAANNIGATQFNDLNDLSVGTVIIEAVSADRAMFAMNGTVDTAAMSVTGVTTLDSDAKLTAGGNLDFEAAVNLGAGDLLLDVDGAVTQQADGSIRSSGLGLMVTGSTILNNPANDVDQIAASNGGDQGAIQFIDADDLTVGVVTIEEVAADPANTDAMIVTGITVDSTAGSTLTDSNFTGQIDLLDNTIQTQQIDGESRFNPSFEEYLTGLGVTNVEVTDDDGVVISGVATEVGVALLSGGELQVSQAVVAESDVFSDDDHRRYLD